MGVRIPNSRGHAKVWESVSPTQGAMPKRESLYPPLKGPRQSVGVRIPNLRGHTEAWESVTPTQGAKAWVWVWVWVWVLGWESLSSTTVEGG